VYFFYNPHWSFLYLWESFSITSIQSTRVALICCPLPALTLLCHISLLFDVLMALCVCITKQFSAT